MAHPDKKVAIPQSRVTDFESAHAGDAAGRESGEYGEIRRLGPRVGVKLTVRLAAKVTARVGVKLTVRLTAKVTVKVGVKLTVRLTAKVTVKVGVKLTVRLTVKVTPKVPLRLGGGGAPLDIDRTCVFSTLCVLGE